MRSGVESCSGNVKAHTFASVTLQWKYRSVTLLQYSRLFTLAGGGRAAGGGGGSLDFPVIPISKLLSSIS